MIQRIQSLWLLLAATAIALMIAFPIAKYDSASQAGFKVSAELNLIAEDNPEMMEQIEGGIDVVMAQSGYIHTWPILVMAILMVVLIVASIFMFGNRMRQLRVVSVSFLLNAMYLFLIMFWAADSFQDSFEQFASTLGCAESSMSYTLGTWLPIVSIIFLLLAQHGIKKDEAKVRAADRLR